MNKILLSALFLLSLNVFGQETLPYQKPPQSIIDLVEAPTTPVVRISSGGNWMLMLETAGLPSIMELSQPELRIGGLRINPANNSTSRANYFNGIKLRSVKKGTDLEFSGLPEDPHISEVSWSPDESKIAFTNTTLEGVELWVADLKTKEAKRLSDLYINSAYGSSFTWAPSGKSILAKFIDPDRGNVPVYNSTPTGPVIQENIGKTSPSRTYQDLLKNPHDEILFDYYLTSVLKVISLTGQISNFGEPSITRHFEYSPDGKYVLIETLKRPYSYLVPANQFPYAAEVFTDKGKLVKSMFNAPLAENLPTGFDAVPKGPREFGWRADKPSTLFWVEAKDNGNPNIQVPLRDVIYTQIAPFKFPAVKLADCYLRFNKITWGNDELAIITERWYKTRAERRVYIKPANETFRVNLFDRYYEDSYSDPGTFVTQKNSFNKQVLLEDDLNIFSISEGASPQGNRPFLLKFNIKTKLTDTLFKSQAPYYEKPVFFNNKNFLISSREAVDSVPNYFYLNLEQKKSRQLSDFSNPYPQLSGIQKHQLNYKRLDGLSLSATLYLPADYNIAEERLPVLMWAYPREFKTASAAGQVKGSPFQFTRISPSSPIYWVTRGYAILDNADMPIVGESNAEPNDTFIDQIRYNAEAAINTLVEMGIADAKRIAIGGHSYGAFMTANLLAHTNLFAAGIARSGAYNRTLTPFGFQSEERTYWQAPDVYSKMSPFAYADKIKEPLLLIHGEADNNSGTFPMQSERFYNALKGHGSTARLVILPAEAHGYRAKESVLHMMWEMDQWLEKYVKGAGQKQALK